MFLKEQTKKVFPQMQLCLNYVQGDYRKSSMWETKKDFPLLPNNLDCSNWQRPLGNLPHPNASQLYKVTNAHNVGEGVALCI